MGVDVMKSNDNRMTRKRFDTDEKRTDKDDDDDNIFSNNDVFL